MTTSDHLKHRTGSLGGDQDEHGVQQVKRCCTSCDANQLCHVCGEQTQFACSDCRIDFGVTIYVCSKKECRDAHEQKCSYMVRAVLAQKTRECEELLSHRLNNDPSKVEWHSPRTVGHLRMQLETIDPATPIAAVYFVKLTGSDVTIARSTGIQLSWERINNETNCIDQGNKELPKSIAVWAHENDGFGPEVLAYLGRADELKTARGMEGTVIDLLNENDALKAQVEQLGRQVAEMSRNAAAEGEEVCYCGAPESEHVIGGAEHNFVVNGKSAETGEAKKGTTNEKS